jgi:hypothetical protein
LLKAKKKKKKKEAEDPNTNSSYVKGLEKSKKKKKKKKKKKLRFVLKAPSELPSLCHPPQSHATLRLAGHFETHQCIEQIIIHLYKL